MRKAVIFDMDGVLVDSQPIHYEADREALYRLGADKDPGVEGYAGTTTPIRFGIYKELLRLDFDTEAAAQLRDNIFAELFQGSSLGPVKGVKELLQALEERGIPLALASSSPPSLIHAIVDKLEIRQYFQYLISGEAIQASKPAPDIFLAAAKSLCVKPEDCVVVEDSEKGVQAGIAANMAVLGYVNQSSGNQNLSLASAIIDDFTKITPEFLLQL